MSKEWSEIKADPKSSKVNELLAKLEEQAKTSLVKTEIKFGTSGWRAVIGETYTVQNVKIAIQAIVEMMKTEVYFKETGLPNFSAVQEKGILIGRDTRFLGKEFARAAAEVFAANGIHAYLIGNPSITPDLSLTVVIKDFAGSVNITPSHNPFEYQGLKFNPADGGTADPILTNVIEAKAEQLMAGGSYAKYIPAEHDKLIYQFESMPVYVNALLNSGVIDFDFIRKNYDPKNITFITDNVHGASAGYLELLLKGLPFPALRNKPDALFGGIKPEPSAENLQLLFSELSKYSTPLKLGVILDPDGDRVRFTDGTADIDMNAFGAIAFHYLATNRQWPGGIAKSVATSNLVNTIAKDLGRPIFETAVGFKNFRKYLKNDQAVCAFEESDGITLRNHTLEKDGVIGALLALEITLRTGKPLGAYLKMLHDKYGVFVPKRFAAPISAEQKQKLATTLSKFKVGDQIGSRTIAEIITLDGFKFVFTDNSWLMIRPSGTEPKVRIYVEAANEQEAEGLFSEGQRLIE
ncbi:MAG: phosphomannomutase [Candidatus Margulisiibacteriota bacterium]|jgi:phosphomannomutase